MHAEHIAIRVLSDLTVLWLTLWLGVSKGKIRTAQSSISSLGLGCAIKSLPAPLTQLT